MVQCKELVSMLSLQNTKSLRWWRPNGLIHLDPRVQTRVREGGAAKRYFLHCWNCDSLAVVAVAHFNPLLPPSRRHM